MSLQNEDKNMKFEFDIEQIKNFTFHVCSLLDRIHSALTYGERIFVIRKLYRFLHITQPLWINTSSFKNVVRAKAFEFMDEPQLYDEMVRTIIEYKWDFCGMPTKNGTQCCRKIKIRNKHLQCYQHNPLSTWYQNNYL